MDSSLQLLVGLGNPGPEYAQSRHNAGAQFVHNVANRYGMLRYEAKFRGQVGNARIGSQDLRLYIPAAYMNECGGSVSRLARFYKLTEAQTLVAHDDLELPPGSVRLKSGGGHGGHNGIRDLIRHFGSADFKRLRIGIGRPDSPDQVSGYVLRKPAKHEAKLIEESMDDALVRLPDIIEGKDIDLQPSGQSGIKRKGRKS